MRKSLVLAVLALAVGIGTAAATDMPRNPIVRQINMEDDLCNQHGCGFLGMFNEDYVPLTFNYDQLPLIRVGYGNDPRTPGDMLGEGAHGSMKLPPGRYRLRGDSGREFTFDIEPFHTKQLHFYGTEYNGEYAVRVTDGGVSDIMMDFRQRRQSELPAPPPPPPEPIHHEGWHDGGGWGGHGPDRWDHPDNQSPWNQPPRHGPPIQHPPEPRPHYAPHIRF